MTGESEPQVSCPRCGTPRTYGCDCVISPEQSLPPDLTREQLARMKNLEIEVRANFGPVLEALRSATGANLQPREEGFHVTVTGPTEYQALEDLQDEDLRELREISAQIQSGEGIEVEGIGYLDGSDSSYRVRSADTAKKTSFVALDIPRLAAFRERIGLPPKDFHITLGFEGGDIHMQVTGQEEYEKGKFKDTLGPIPKQADPRFAGIAEELPDMTFGGFSGEEKEEKIVKIDKTKKEKKREQKSYDGEKLRTLLSDLVKSGESGGVTEDRIDRIVEIAMIDPNGLGRELGADFRFVRSSLEQSKKE